MPFSSSLRWASALLLAPLALAARPAWVDAATESGLPVAPVAAVLVGGEQDWVQLAAGAAAGLRPGQRLAVYRPDATPTPVGEVLVAAVRPAQAYALLLHLEPGQTVQTGDLAAARLR